MQYLCSTYAVPMQSMYLCSTYAIYVPMQYLCLASHYESTCTNIRGWGTKVAPWYKHCSCCSWWKGTSWDEAMLNYFSLSSSHSPTRVCILLEYLRCVFWKRNLYEYRARWQGRVKLKGLKLWQFKINCKGNERLHWINDYSSEVSLVNDLLVKWTVLLEYIDLAIEASLCYARARKL